MKYLRLPKAGEPVRVYRNLHRACWSVQALVQTGDPQRCSRYEWRVIFHAQEVVVGDARFTVNEAGRQRVIRERQKNIHAFVEGRLLGVSRPEWLMDQARFTVPVKYNPYKAGYFYRQSDEGVPYQMAEAAWLRADARVWARPEPGTS